MKKEFYYIRHGQTDVNKSAAIKRVDYDLPLNSLGISQAENARATFKRLQFGHIYSSPILRATQTRDIILDKEIYSITVDDAFSECKAAVWTKMVEQEDREDLAVKDFLTNVRKGLSIVCEAPTKSLIVSHGGFHWGLCYLLGIKNHPWKIDNCQFVRFTYNQESHWEASCLS